MTKALALRAKAGEIAVINHADIDELAAKSLVAKGIVAVIDCAEAASGRYPAAGPEVLLDAGIAVVDKVDPGFMNLVGEGDVLEIKGGKVFRDGTLVAEGRVLNEAILSEILSAAEEGMAPLMEEFFQNTLKRAAGETRAILEGPPPLRLRTRLKGHHVLVVVRGRRYKEDLRTILPYIREVKPVLLAVDGGADALLEEGLKPRIILGDMDSVTDIALRSGAELVVHAYPDGKAPGLGRLRAMGLDPLLLPCPGTSEDAAMLLAHSQGARLIVAVGAHSDFLDFQEKNRPGMASTLLVRMKVGPILVDAKGVSQLYQRRIKTIHLLEIGLAASLPLVAAGIASPVIRDLLRLVLLRARLTLGF